MKTELSITLALDAIFHQTCKELGLTATCIREEVDANRYEIEYRWAHDLFYLGINMGMTATQKIFTE